MKSVLIVFTVTFILTMITSIIANRTVNRSLKIKEETVLSSSKPEKSTFRKGDIESLPPVVKRYFSLVLTDGQRYIESVSLQHSGTFRADLDGRWMNIRGKQVFTAGTPQFHWTGKTALFTASDSFTGGKGELRVYLFGSFPIVRTKGPATDQGELLRWLGESVWFPTNLLPSDYLHWSFIDEKRALLVFTFDDLELKYIVTFNERGEICRFETQRHMGDEGLHTWIGKVGDYRKVDGMLIPMHLEAAWVLNGKELPYARFDIEKITFEPDNFY